MIDHGEVYSSYVDLPHSPNAFPNSSLTLARSSYTISQIRTRTEVRRGGIDGIFQFRPRSMDFADSGNLCSMPMGVLWIRAGLSLDQAFGQFLLAAHYGQCIPSDLYSVRIPGDCRLSSRPFLKCKKEP
jgi:hypothetical protein